MSDLIVTARFVCDPTTLEKAREILNELAISTRQEMGCLEYGYFERIDAPGHFTSIERWANAEAEAAHWEEPHLKVALQGLGPIMVGEAEVEKFNMI